MKIALIRREFSATGGAELYLQRLDYSRVSPDFAAGLIRGERL